MQALRERTHNVRSINDLLYHIIEPETEIKRIIDKLSGFIDLPHARKEKLCSDGQLRALREDSLRPSEKIAQFLHHAVQESQATVDQCLRDFEACVQAIQEREVIGTGYCQTFSRRNERLMGKPIFSWGRHI